MRAGEDSLWILNINWKLSRIVANNSVNLFKNLKAGSVQYLALKKIIIW